MQQFHHAAIPLTGGDTAELPLAIGHLDESGCGALRFALGLEGRALNSAGRSEAVPVAAASVANTVSQYGGSE